MGFSHGKAARMESTMKVSPVICRKRFMCASLTIHEVMTPTVRTAGIVPEPKASIVSELRSMSPVVADSAKAV